jgi:thymidylate synthase
MFFLQVSYLAILHAVARQCGLPYVSVIHQVVDDGSHMYGVELQLSQQLDIELLAFESHPHYSLSSHRTKEKKMIPIQIVTSKKTM